MRAMWFLFMLLGLYIVTPALLLLEKEFKPSILYGKLPWVFLAVSTISYWSRPYSFAVGYDVGIQAEFLSFYLVGYAIRRRIKEKGPSNIRGVAFILAGVAVEFLLAGLRYKRMYDGIPFNDQRVPFDLLAFEGLGPFVVVSSVLIFAGFSSLKIGADFSDLSSLSFLVYLFHIGVLDVMMFASKRLKLFPTETATVIPICVAVVFLLSLFAASIYRTIWQKLEGKYNITNKICTLFKLVT